MLREILSKVVLVCLFCNSILIQAFAQTPADLGLPKPGTMVALSSTFTPVLVRGIKVHPENPILFDFIVDTGDTGIAVNSTELKEQANEQIKYFLAALTIPAKDLWVNLSPYEKDRILPESLGQTTLGRDMLAQDYLLKQITASLIYPEKKLGRTFWDRVYAKVQANYGNVQVPVNAFNKVWVVADRAKVLVRDQMAFIVDSHVKVMLDRDYQALNRNLQAKSFTKMDQSASMDVAQAMIKEIVLPELEREVNQGKNFAALRQMYHSMILAAWYKKNLKQTILNQVYVNRGKTGGVKVDDPTIKEQIYQEYLKAYKKGVFNLIKEEPVNQAHQRQARKYFAGGVLGVDEAMITEVNQVNSGAVSGKGQYALVQAAADKSPLNDVNALMPVSDHILTQLDKGQKQSRHLISTFLGNNPVLKDGWTFGVDASGTNLRIAALEIKGEKVVRVIVDEPYRWDSGGYKQKGDIFQLMASRLTLLKKEAIKNGMPPNTPLRIALSFAFAMDQTDITTAKVLGLPKGWQAREEYIGQNPAALLEQALRNEGYSENQARVLALMNDTTATQLNVPGAIMAIILGTGFNISVFDPTTNQILNGEAGGVEIPPFILTEADKKFIEYLKSIGQWNNQYERFITSESLAQLMRISLAQENFGGAFQAYLADPNYFKGKTKNDEDRFALLGKIEAAGSQGNWQEMRQLFANMFEIPDGFAKEMLTDEQTQKVYEIIKGLTDRAAHLVAASIHALARRVDGGLIELATNGYVIPVDGSVFWKYFYMKERIAASLNEIFDFQPESVFYTGDLNEIPRGANQIIFVFVDTASARGAGLGVADKEINNNQIVAGARANNAMLVLSSMIVFRRNTGFDRISAAEANKLVSEGTHRFQQIGGIIRVVPVSQKIKPKESNDRNSLLKKGNAGNGADPNSVRASQGKAYGNRDRAMNVNGGIDFNTDAIKLDQTGETVNWQFDQSMLAALSSKDFTGLTPRILRVRAINSIITVLGLNP